MDAFLLSLRETIEFSLILLLLSGIYKEHKKILLTSAALVITAGFLITVVNSPLSGSFEKLYVSFMSCSFLLILYLPFIPGRKVVYPVLCIFFALLLPSAQLASVIIGEAFLKGGYIYLYSSAGILTGAAIFVLGMSFMATFDLKRIFDSRSIMVFIAALSFLFGGLNEFDKTPAITSLHRGMLEILSYFILYPQKFLLSISAGNITENSEIILNYLLSERFAMAVTALALFIPPLYVFIKLLLTPEPSTEGIEVKAERRKIFAVYIDELIRKGTPLLMALLVIIVLLHSSNLAMSPSYDPEPIPIVTEEKMITIPLKGKYGDISDGRIRKFSFREGDEAFRFIVIMRPDGEVIAALDACEICPDYGYVQRGKHVICKYCSTPIPLPSLGSPGGCNPIPLASETEGENLIISKDQIADTYNKWLGKNPENAHSR